MHWWPPAPGWWLLTLLLLVLLGWALRSWRNYYRRNTFRRQALRELNQICHQRPLPLGPLLSLVRRAAASTGKYQELTSCNSYNLLNLIISDSGVAGAEKLDAKSLADALYQPGPPVLEDTEARILCRCSHVWISKLRGQQSC